MMKVNFRKQKIIFFSRYPIEFEVIPLQGFRKVIDDLLDDKEIIYYSMGWSRGADNKLREGIKVKELPLKIDIVSSLDKWLKTALYYLILPYSIFQIHNLKPDIIICKENMPFVPLSLGVLRKPILVEIGDWWPSMILGHTQLGKKIANFLENLEVKLWNKGDYTALVHNNSEKKVILEKGLSAKKIEIITLPMLGKDYFPCSATKERHDLGFTNKDFVVATHGIIHKSKGYNQVLYWWKKITQDHPDWKLLFIGGTMGEKWFRQIIENLNLKDKVIITGWISNQDKLNSYLNAADCLLVTRRNTKDNFGTTPSGLTHSLMTAKPTIATGTPSIADIVRDRKDGYIFEPDNYTSFKKALEEVYNDQKKAKKIGLAGLKRVKERFNPHNTAKGYRQIISNIKG